MKDVSSEIVEIIADKTGKSVDSVHLSDPLEELGLDSLGVVELTFLIEEKFDLEIPFNANFDIAAKTVGDLVQTVTGLVAAKGSVA